MSEIKIYAIGSCIILEGSDIALEDWISWKNRHAGRMDDMPKERTIYQRFRWSVKRLDNTLKEYTIW